MRIERLEVSNFRNFSNLDLTLSSGTVIVGENRTGKSNLVHALRLVLDSDISNHDRQLNKDDFWDGLSDGTPEWDPMDDEHEIEISVEIGEFENNTAIVAALAGALLDDSPLRARLTYKFAKVTDIMGEERYRGRIYGAGDESSPVSSELRSYLHLEFLHALRDVEEDIRHWRRSPLRKMLEAVALNAPEKDLEVARAAITDANDAVGKIDGIASLAEEISNQTRLMVGPNQALKTSLKISPQEPARLIRAMRLLIDGDAERPLSAASLGNLNILYLALLELGLKNQLMTVDIAHVVMAIEEPEAHLHPHLQRLVFRRILESGNGQW